MKPLIATLACLAAVASVTPAQGASYVIDATHTFVSFEVLHLGTSTSRGRFDKSEGTLEFDREARKGRVEITIDATSINTGLPALDKVLRGDDFFDTDKHPSARFVADRFVFKGNQVAEVAGSLTLLGKTLPVTLKAMRFNCYPHPFLKREACGGDFEAAILRSLWGMNTYAPDMVGDTVRLLVQIEAIKQ